MCDQAPPSSCSAGKSQRGPERVAIVGCGFTGTSAFFQLVTEHPVKEIVIFEKSGIFGPGYAWQATERSDYLANNTNSTLCLVPGNLSAFYQWMTQCQNEDVDKNSHASRSHFGDFLLDAIRSSKTVAAIKGIKVTFIPKEVVDVREELNCRGKVVSHIVTMKDGGEGGEEGEEEVVVVDAALITTGKSPYVERFFPDSSSPSPPFSPPSPSHTSPIYIPEHVNVPPETFDSLPLDATIHILGASLSAFDVVNGLFSPSTSCEFVRDEKSGKLKFVPGDNNRKVVLCSRSGRLKKVGGVKPMDIKITHFTEENVRRMYEESTKGLTLEDLGALLKEEVKSHNAEHLTDFNEILDPYAGCGSVEEVTKRAGEIMERDVERAVTGTNFMLDLGNKIAFVGMMVAEEGWLSGEEEKRYREEFETLVLGFFAAAPILTGERLVALFEAGRIQVVKGIKNVSYSSGSHFTIHHAFGEEEAQFLVNTSGSISRAVSSPLQPSLVKRLHERGVLKGHSRAMGKEGGEEGEKRLELQGAAIDMKTMKVKGSKTIYMVNMLVWGPSFFTSSALLMAFFVQRAFKDLYG